MEGKALAMALCSIWQDMLAQEPLSPEINYRLRKMASRIIPLFDKVYLKTTKASEIISGCTRQTKLLREALVSDTENIYLILTRLEKDFEELLKKTYEFRIKAG